MTTPPNLKPQEAITKLGRIVLPYPPYRPNLAASECHLFGAHKGVTHSTKFGSDDEVIEEVAVSTKFKLVQEGDRCSCFLLAQGCGGWRLCRKMRCIIHPSSLPVGMSGELCKC